MFIRVEKKTLEEKIISSEEMVRVLESDLKPDEVDEALTDMVLGTYEHRTATAIYKYRA
ncbi:hypothetical protein Ga0123462_0254 [Mariprofundus ferrinatatus]|uniref:Uncharacterized protein n=1 Tax=Mariprofundus ferrinatatus TaxID=1921087 RepID=A0A2K8L1D4_9PROT|nr:N-carbamoyl-L-amino acid amidohydrolase [Mariprofundus ferrinatatus]ATX81130.1 hypothetical protein Ga0123462_0254 [Mariprofundus ferrinatatus]